ncbi:hypothetical protein TREMEDRAFT_67650 [Tremella mesenterica DSM 1558]|uniref:uncharacterized protein n=1 Tax=Tremella mesenterica (strain ATCC 24925 / CBS 8224 / DSM 1558 / NBRC 9311 / NRRL Y-6157 / RJB 2259-6 / UBC 559-6) TaxID=578456 RepID=UPI0003F496B4|nr:uncharacterized protein TREMEDRAFT_67650 [Tremella mesenterica DSM 1558]EIW71259.1 hypothetical protein TREMEDRAFT_67650 [Tremella mesenterica DSM 1558]
MSEERAAEGEHPAHEEEKPREEGEEAHLQPGVSTSDIKTPPPELGQDLAVKEEGNSNTGLQLEHAVQPSHPNIELSPSKSILHEPIHLNPHSHAADELHAPDSPTTSLISSLRMQLALLAEQSQQLNNKLVASISRHADLEDQHFNLQHEHDDLRRKAEELQKSKSQWEESMNTGLLVERTQITAEMQRLAAGLVEEERRRGSAEERRQKVESEVDDLAASLFDQANTMVATERLGRMQAEDRLKTAEENLAAAEAAVRDMQLHLQSLPTSAQSPHDARAPRIPRRYLSSHVPYSEFITFLTHLRTLRHINEKAITTFPPPLLINLLNQPFIARIIAEDQDPSLRLDTAPDLNYFSRRAVSNAIIAGELVIEPVSAMTVISATTAGIYDISCSLCGKPVFHPSHQDSSPAVGAGGQFGPPPLHPSTRSTSTGGRFSLKPFFASPSPNPQHSPNTSPAPSPRPTQSLPSVYIFRIARQAPGVDKEKETQNRSYPLCRSGWCLERLRAICELWHFVRTNIVQVVWVGDDGHVIVSSAGLGPTIITGDGQSSRVVSDSSTVAQNEKEEPKKKSSWALGFKLTEKSSSWRDGEGEKEKQLGEPVSDKDEEDKGGLAAPIELRTESPAPEDTVDKEKDLPSIQEPAEVTGEEMEKLEKVEVEKSPAVSATAASEIETDDGASFSTPKGGSVDIHEQDLNQEASVAVQETVSHSSSTPIKEKNPSIASDNDYSDEPPTMDEPTKEEGEVEGMSEDKPNVISLDEPINGTTEMKEKSTIDNDAKKTEKIVPLIRELPPLPPRHPKTPTMQIEVMAGERERSYIGERDDGWDAKMWTNVVRLKESIWRTRVGVIDG